MYIEVPCITRFNREVWFPLTKPSARASASLGSAYGPLLDAEPGHVDSVDGAVQLWLARSGRLRWT